MCHMLLIHKSKDVSSAVYKFNGQECLIRDENVDTYYSNNIEIKETDMPSDAKFDTFISLREPTDEQCNEAAINCEDFCKLYPVYFPKKILTRKMTEYSLCYS